MDKKNSRLRRARKTRSRIRSQRTTRLCINRTPKHIYAQIIAFPGNKVVASASTVETEFRSTGKNGGNVAAAKEVGKKIAERAVAAGVTTVAFDRSGYKYHGRVKALADTAREAGLNF